MVQHAKKVPSNKCTLILMVNLAAFFFAALVFNEDCAGGQKQQLSVSTAIACGPSTILFLWATMPLSIEIVRCAWYYRCIHNAPAWVDNVAFTLAPIACASLFLLTFPYNTYEYEKEHRLCAEIFFVSVYLHTLYVTSLSCGHKKWENKQRAVCALCVVASLVLVTLALSWSGVFERSKEWFASTEVAFMGMVAVYAYLLKSIVDESGKKPSFELLPPCGDGNVRSGQLRL